MRIKYAKWQASNEKENNFGQNSFLINVELDLYYFSMNNYP